MTNSKKIFLFTTLFAFFAAVSLTFAQDSSTPKQNSTNYQSEFTYLKSTYYPHARNNEIYLLPQDFTDSRQYLFYIKEFKNGFQKGQLLVGNYGFPDLEYLLVVIDTTVDTAIAAFVSGNPNIQRYDRLLIDTREPNYPK